MKKYTLYSLSKIPAPEGAQSKRWYCYIISNGTTVINGQRSGTEKEVLEFARNCTKTLNQKYPGLSQHLFKPAYTHFPHEFNF